MGAWFLWRGLSSHWEPPFREDEPDPFSRGSRTEPFDPELLGMTFSARGADAIVGPLELVGSRFPEAVYCRLPITSRCSEGLALSSGGKSED